MRSAAEIERDIAKRRSRLAATLDEIAVRVHPKTMAESAKTKVTGAVDRTAGQAYVFTNRAITEVRSRFVSEKGEPRWERIVPVAAVAAVVVIAVAGRGVRRRRRR